MCHLFSMRGCCHVLPCAYPMCSGKVSVLYFDPPSPPNHHHHKLWNTYYMELKHLTDYELYTGLQLFPVQATGVYPIVWSSPDRVYTCFCRSILCVIPTGFYIQPDRDYFHTIYYPDRVCNSV